MNAYVLTLAPATPRFEWGTDGLVLWIEDLDVAGSVEGNLDEVLTRIGFGIELQTGWDHRTDAHTYHPMYGYHLLLRDGTGHWNAIRTDGAGKFRDLIPLEESDYEVAYDRAMWVD
jgi:hypothetical protein